MANIDLLVPYCILGSPLIVYLSRKVWWSVIIILHIVLYHVIPSQKKKKKKKFFFVFVGLKI